MRRRRQPKSAGADGPSPTSTPRQQEHEDWSLDECLRDLGAGKREAPPKGEALRCFCRQTCCLENLDFYEEATAWGGDVASARRLHERYLQQEAADWVCMDSRTVADMAWALRHGTAAELEAAMGRAARCARDTLASDVMPRFNAARRRRRRLVAKKSSGIHVVVPAAPHAASHAASHAAPPTTPAHTVHTGSLCLV